MRHTLAATALATALVCTTATAQVAQVVDWGSSTAGTLGSVTVEVVALFIALEDRTSQPFQLLTGSTVTDAFGGAHHALFAGPVSLNQALGLTLAAGTNEMYDVVFSQPVQDVRVSFGDFASRAWVFSDGGWSTLEAGSPSWLPGCGAQFLGCVSSPAAASSGTVRIPGLSQSMRLGFQSLGNAPDSFVLQIAATAPTAPVPEPGSWALLLAGGAALLTRCARRPRSAAA